jgi:tetratricopeptide (TPR) repeat protein
MTKEATFWEQLKAISPDSVETFKAATTAMDSDKYDDAVTLYQTVYKKAPHFDVVMRRLGMCLALQGKTAEGLALLQDAVAINRNTDNLSALAQYLAYPGDNKQSTPQQKAQAFALMKEAMAMPHIDSDDDYYQLILGQLALDNGDLPTFRKATERLSVIQPNSPATHYFKAVLAANEEDWFTAEREIKTAEDLGLPHEVAQEFLDAGIHTRVTAYRLLIYAVALVLAWIVGLVALFLVGKLMSRRTLRSIEDADPNVATTSAELSLRKLYRRLISVAGFYYYLSIPFVIFLVVAVAGGITYAAFMAGQIPIKLILILDIGALVTSYKMIRSLFIKIEREDPGRALTQEEAPALWDLTRRVAETIGTRAVDEIRITPGTDLAVYERGSRREKANDQAHRILLVGLGVVNGFEINAFRAVLAHEYGHFSHRDTAGGEVALRVNQDMIKFARAMVLSRQNVWWNVAFHFLRIYLFIFRRISHGATRLQEVLADRIAALKYGAAAFEEGLKHVIMKSVEFETAANSEIKASAEARRALQNIYDLPLIHTAEVAQAAEESLNRETSEDDTHPCPNDRFRLTRKVNSQTEPPLSGMVWDLFKDKLALTTEMTALIQTRLQNY